jgi:hypothetical protein
MKTIPDRIQADRLQPVETQATGKMTLVTWLRQINWKLMFS